MKNSKLVKNAGIMDRIAKVIGGVVQAFGIVFAVFAVLVAVLGQKMFMDGPVSLELDFVTIHLVDQISDVAQVIQMPTVIGLAVLSATSFLICRGISLLRQILEPMKQGRPFDETIPETLKKISWIVLISGVAVQLVGAAEFFGMILALPMDQVFTSPAIASVEYNYVFDLNFLWVFFLIRFLSYIFAYGQRLQQEYDETL